MSDIPDQLTLKRNRDREGTRDVVLRRIGVAAVGVFLALGLLNLFGQRPHTSSAAGPAAQLSVYAPSRVRSGIYYEARFHIRANRDLRNATLVLDSGWAEGITINTVEPSPIGEGSRDGRLVFELGHVPARQSYLFFLQLQVNPTNVGRRSQDIELFDEDTHIATVERSITIFP